ncbi:DgyrCDS1390 [Dimorphilus gyrociliatus]|uniref:DgyrCDS1390 n=1 Tax=Dimorphilus gyrociliatus TaxID=2664684 RepID=A0A7I8V994_9ANNE|nr:DgyrCDS1390 [Dimorphilus gyrociliatus]
MVWEHTRRVNFMDERCIMKENVVMILREISGGRKKSYELKITDRSQLLWSLVFSDADVNGLIDGWAKRNNKRAYVTLVFKEKTLTLLGGIDYDLLDLEEISSIIRHRFDIKFISEKFRLEDSNLKSVCIQRIKNIIYFIGIREEGPKCFQTCAIESLLKIPEADLESKKSKKQIRMPLSFFNNREKSTLILKTRKITKYFHLKNFINKLNPDGQVSNELPSWIDYCNTTESSETELSFEIENSLSIEQQTATDSSGIIRLNNGTFSYENSNSDGSEIPPENDVE